VWGRGMERKGETGEGRKRQEWEEGQMLLLFL